MRLRTRIMTAAAVAGGIMILGQGATAQTAEPARRPPRTTAGLAEVCATPTSSPDYMAATYFCRGFLAGAAQYHAAMHPVGGRNRPMFCVPEPPPRLMDAAAAFVTWARANPQHGDEPAVDGLMRFAEQTYPCPAQAPQRRGSRR